MFEWFESPISDPVPPPYKAAGELTLGNTRRRSYVARTRETNDAAESFVDDVSTAMACLPPGVDEAARVERIASLERLKSACCAAQAKEACLLERDMSARREAQGTYKNNPGHGAGAEVALARKETQHLGPEFIRYSAAMIESMPYTFDALMRGELTEERAMILVRKTHGLAPGAREAIDRNMAGERGALEGVGTKQLRARVEKEALAFDSGLAVIAHQDSMSKRCVSVSPMGNGMMRLSGILPVAEGMALREALLAAKAKRRTAEDRRTDTQVMADTLVERVTGHDIASHPPLMLHMTMTDRTLISGDSEPAHLKGYGTIPAEYARWLIAGDRAGADGENTAELWVRRLYTAPSSGELLAMDSRARAVPKQMREMITVRDQFCRTPYCDAPIRQIDHVHQAYKGGRTAVENLNGRCAWCNQTKETEGWEEYVVMAQRHAILVKTPSGQVYLSLAPPLPGTQVAPPGPCDSVVVATSP